MVQPSVSGATCENTGIQKVDKERQIGPRKDNKEKMKHYNIRLDPGEAAKKYHTTVPK